MAQVAETGLTCGLLPLHRHVVLTIPGWLRACCLTWLTGASVNGARTTLDRLPAQLEGSEVPPFPPPAHHPPLAFSLVEGVPASHGEFLHRLFGQR